MSGHDHADAEQASHDGAHEPETSSDDFPDDEPRSPGWLPLLGGALFLVGVFVLVIFGGEPKAGENGAADNNGPGHMALDGANNPAQRPAIRIPSMPSPGERQPPRP